MNALNRWPLVLTLFLALLARVGPSPAATNLVVDGSFEQPKPKDRWGLVFTHWGGWIYEGQCEFRVSDLAHSGAHSLLIVGGTNPKIRASPSHMTLEPGRYRITAWLRGLDIGTGVWNQTTEFMFEGKYLPLSKNGTFGWTPLTYVGEVKSRREFGHPSFGLMAPGYLWVDDVTVEPVGPEVELTTQPVLGAEERAVSPPGEIGLGAVRCLECGYRNMPAWGRCFACGAVLGAGKAAPAGPPVQLITSFEDKNPFGGGKLVNRHATDGTNAFLLERSFMALDRPQNWTGYDYIKADVFTESTRPVELYFEVRDTATRDYWTRVNYTTVIPPGASTLVIPTALYVGEKSRPGRPLILNGIQRMVFSIGDNPSSPVYLDHIRLERDTETGSMLFEGLWAFDLGTGSSPVMEGFTALDMSKGYTRGRGYGWKAAKFWRAFDALQPDPLYQDFICVEGGGLAIDLPNGRYHVWLNMDSPSGFWGEFQRYRKRAVILEGLAREDTMSLAQFKQRYFRFWDTEDLPADNTFDKYQRPYFTEKEFDVEVKDHQLNIDFSGENWACAVSAIVVYPAEKSEQGRKFLQFVQARRQFHFENYFKRVLHQPTPGEFAAIDPERARGFVVFSRDYMRDVYYNDRPLPGERITTLTGSAFAGEYEPLLVSIAPLRDLGRVSVVPTDLNGPGASIPAQAIEVAVVSYRLSRVTMEGSVYTIAPRLLMPANSAPVPNDVTRTYWCTVKVPENAPAGLYRGALKIAVANQAPLSLPIEFTVRKSTLDALDIPAGPWGHTIDLPWDEPAAAEWNAGMAEKSLRKLREYGFTTCSGLPVVNFQGFRDGQPMFDFKTGDLQMRRLREAGFAMPVVSYTHFGGLNTYYQDEEAMKRAGFSDYSLFVKAVFGAVQAHARSAGWLPVYWNLGDEPIGDDLTRGALNAEAYRKAFPQGPPFFTAATSFSGTNIADPHFRFSKALHVADWNLHDEPGIKLLHDAGGNWGFYNGGNRWTYGAYLYKAAKEFGLKFRLSWHWNVVAGDPYYALDCREDDYAWCNSSPDGDLIPSIHFEQLREGLDDYRRMLTLARLCKEQAGSPAARESRQILDTVLGSFRLGDREPKDLRAYSEIRARLDEAIERLRP